MTKTTTLVGGRRGHALVQPLPLTQVRHNLEPKGNIAMTGMTVLHLSMMNLLDQMPLPLTDGDRAAIFVAVDEPNVLSFGNVASVVLVPGNDRRGPLTLGDFVAFNPDADIADPGALEILDALRCAAEHSLSPRADAH